MYIGGAARRRPGRAQPQVETHSWPEIEWVHGKFRAYTNTHLEIIEHHLTKGVSQTEHLIDDTTKDRIRLMREVVDEPPDEGVGRFG